MCNSGGRVLYAVHVWIRNLKMDGKTDSRRPRRIIRTTRRRYPRPASHTNIPARSLALRLMHT